MINSVSDATLSSTTSATWEGYLCGHLHQYPCIPYTLILLALHVCGGDDRLSDTVIPCSLYWHHHNNTFTSLIYSSWLWLPHELGGWRVFLKHKKHFSEYGVFLNCITENEVFKIQSINKWLCHPGPLDVEWSCTGNKNCYILLCHYNNNPTLG